MRRLIFNLFMPLLASSGVAFACPSGQTSGFPGICYPNIGGDIGRAWEKSKEEISNFEGDVRELIKTGKCGGDFCDVFASAVEFGREEAIDIEKSVRKAGQRISEGKPLDAIWHLHTDYVSDMQENAAKAALRSRVLMATGQVAASVYGAPYGAAAYTAWLAYNTTGDLSNSLKAGIISGLSAAALGSVSDIKLENAVQGAAARSALTGAINGAAVAASGGSADEIKAAATMGVITVLIREGYREITSHELNNERLRSSTGEAYCLATMPDPSYLAQTSTSGCFAPPSAYLVDKNGVIKLKQGKALFKLLDPDRPHVGQWGKEQVLPSDFVTERSGAMTTVSRIAGWNAMSVAHDVISDELGFALLPAPLGDAILIGTIPPAVVLTYIGTGAPVHDSIRNTFEKQLRKDNQPKTVVANDNQIQQEDVGSESADTEPLEPVAEIELLDIVCGIDKEGNPLGVYGKSEFLVSVYLDGNGKDRDLACELEQTLNGISTPVVHAHYDRNYCHKHAEKIIRRKVSSGDSCFISTALVQKESTATAPR